MRAYHGSPPKRGHAPVATRWMPATASLIAAMKNSANAYQRTPTRQSSSRASSARAPARPDSRHASQSATDDGANEPRMSSGQRSAAAPAGSAAAAMKQTHVMP